MNNRLKHSLLFLLGTLLCTWTLYFLIVFLKLNPYSMPGAIFLFFGGCTPTLLGFIMVMITYSKAEKLDYLKRIYQAKRIKPLWWATILLLFPAIMAVSIALNALLGGTVPEMIMLKNIISNPFMFFLYAFNSFMSGPFSEELGWRGFALDPLLDKFGFIKASVLLGLIWGIWHLPLYFMPQTWHGKMGFQLAGFWGFLIMSVGLSIIMSFIYIRTSRSILSAMLVHLSNNFAGQLISGTAGPGYSPKIEMIRSLIVIIIGICICSYIKRCNQEHIQA